MSANVQPTCRMEEVQHPDNLKDKEEQMLRQNCWYVVLSQGDARNGEANKLLMLPPFKSTADKRKPEDVQIRRRMDENKANEIMVTGLPPDQRAILQEHADPFDRWKALQSFFHVIGDRKTPIPGQADKELAVHEEKNHGRVPVWSPRRSEVGSSRSRKS